MKREQLEKITRAMHALLDATEGVRSASVSRNESGRRVAFYPETDEDLHAMCGAFGVRAERMLNTDGSWWLAASADVGTIRVNVLGPTHRKSSVQIDDDKVDDAVKTAAKAVAGDDISGGHP